MVPDLPLSACHFPIDTLIVAGGTGTRRAEEDDQLIEWLKEAARRSRRVTSVCTGAFLLARAGLLDGRRATSHWASCADLAERYPSVTVEFLKRPGGQAQFSAQLAAHVADRAPLRELQAWIPGHLSEDLSVPALARRTRMSERNVARETGMTPATYVEAARVESIALESGDLPVESVARQAGFGTVETMRRAFGRRVRVSPVDHKSRFRRQAA